MFDALPLRSPTRSVSGYEFVSRVLSRFPEDGVRKLLAFAGNESDWLEKKAGVYLWDKDPDLEKLRKRSVDDNTFKEQYRFLDAKLCRVIAEAIIAFRNMRGGVVFIGIKDSPENRVVPLRDNDPKGFLGKEKNDFDKYIRQAVEARLWPEKEIFEDEDADWRRPGLPRSHVFETRTAKYEGETILALLVRAPRPDESPLVFKEEPRGGRSKDWLLYREPGNKGEINRVVLVHPSANSLNTFLINDRQPALRKTDLAEQAARWGISFSVPEPPPLPKKASRFSFRPIAVIIAVFAAVPVLLVALVIVLVLLFPAEDDEDGAADGRAVPKNFASAEPAAALAGLPRAEPATPSGSDMQVDATAEDGSAGPSPGEVRTVTLPGGVPLDLVWVPPGTFAMGLSKKERSPCRTPTGTIAGDDTDCDELRPRTVSLPRGFWLAKTELTETQWSKIEYGEEGNPTRYNANRPRILSWKTAERTIKKLNRLDTGLSFRFPTSTEWEWAARGGPLGGGFAWSGSDDPDDVAWTADSWPPGGGSPYSAQFPDVATKRPNELGLFDMAGSYSEWCLDSHDPPDGSARADFRVLRGGSLFSPAAFCRNGSHNAAPADDSTGWTGLRVAADDLAGASADIPAAEPPVFVPRARPERSDVEIMSDVFDSLYSWHSRERPAGPGESQDISLSSAALLPQEAVEWDDEDRFAARREAAVQCRKFADWLSRCTNGLIRPVADAKGIVRIRRGEIVATADIAGTPGVRKVLLDGGELLFSRRLDELLHFHREATNIASRAERGIATDEEIRDSPAERMRSRLSREDDRPFEIPIEIGPSGGWITRKRFDLPVRGPIESVVKSRLSASPDGSGPTVATGIRFPPLEDSSIYSILFGSYSIWTSPDPKGPGTGVLYRHGSRGHDSRDVESVLFPLGRLSAIMPPSETWNERLSSHRRMFLSGMKDNLRSLLSESVSGTPDESGDIVVPRLKVLLTGDIPDDGVTKRIVLRGGTIVFGPSREEIRSIHAKLETALGNARGEDNLPPDESLFPPPARIRRLSVPILVEKAGGNIRNDPFFTEEAWLLSPVSNVFGERPQLCIVGGVFVDPHEFSRKINVFGSSNKPIDQAEQSDSLLWLCDFSGPFPRRLSQKGENNRDNRILSSRRFVGPMDTTTLERNTDWE